MDFHYKVSRLPHFPLENLLSPSYELWVPTVGAIPGWTPGEPLRTPLHLHSCFEVYNTSHTGNISFSPVIVQETPHDLYFEATAVSTDSTACNWKTMFPANTTFYTLPQIKQRLYTSCLSSTWAWLCLTPFLQRLDSWKPLKRTSSTNLTTI